VTTAVKVAALPRIYLQGPVSIKTVGRELPKSNIHDKVAITKLLITENSAKSEKDGVMIIKPGRLMIGST
jgi:hypothetical protein